MARIDVSSRLPRFAPPRTAQHDRGRPLTLLDLIEAVSDAACSDAEVVATIEHLLSSGRVRLLR